MTVLPVITAVLQPVIVMMLILILYHRQKTIDGLMRADTSHNEGIDLQSRSIALLSQRIEAIEARLDGKGPDGVENALRVAVDTAIRQGSVKQFGISLRHTGTGDLTTAVKLAAEGQKPDQLSDNPEYRLFTNPRTGTTIQLDMNQPIEGAIDGKPVGAMPLGKLLGIVGEASFIDSIFEQLEPAPKNVH